MVNHFYTVLLNTSGPRIPTVGPISELSIYIPKYQAKIVPSELSHVHHLLFGDCVTDEDRIQKAYQLVRLVESSDMSAFVTASDTRVTYSADRPLVEAKLGPSLTFSVEMIPGIPMSVSSGLLSVNEEVGEYFVSAETYVDKLAALTIAFVLTMEKTHE